MLRVHAAVAQDSTPDRSAWRYTQKDLVVAIEHRGEEQWVADRSDGQRHDYREVDRSEESITLQNEKTKLLLRLHEGQGYWKTPSDEEWTKWVRGSWISPQRKPPYDRGSREYSIRLAYFVPRDRKPVKQYELKIRLIMSMVADVYLKDLRGKGYVTDGLQFETEDELPVVRLVQGERDASYYNGAPDYNAGEQWRRLLPEIRSEVGDPQRQLIVVFTETYDDGPAERLWPGVIARGAYRSAEGGLAIYSAHLLRDEFCATTLQRQLKLLFDETPVRGRAAWGHRMNSPRCEFIEDGIGAVAHELGHALGLPHDRRDDARDIMGNGFRNLRWNFAGDMKKRAEFSAENALLLMSSRYLANDLELEDNEPPKVEATPMSNKEARTLLSVTATDETGLRAIVFIDRTAGSVVAGRKLSGKKQQFVQRFRKRMSPDTKLQIIVTDQGGNQTRN